MAPNGNAKKMRAEQVIQKTGGIWANGQTATQNRPENYVGFGVILGDFEPLAQCWVFEGLSLT